MDRRTDDSPEVEQEAKGEEVTPWWVRCLQLPSPHSLPAGCSYCWTRRSWGSFQLAPAAGVDRAFGLAESRRASAQRGTAAAPHISVIDVDMAHHEIPTFKNALFWPSSPKDWIVCIVRAITGMIFFYILYKRQTGNVIVALTASAMCTVFASTTFSYARCLPEDSRKPLTSIGEQCFLSSIHLLIGSGLDYMAFEVKDLVPLVSIVLIVGSAIFISTGGWNVLFAVAWLALHLTTQEENRMGTPSTKNGCLNGAGETPSGRFPPATKPDSGTE